MIPKINEIYLYEVINNEKISLESKLQHVEIFLESKGVLSTELINYILNYNEKFFNIEFKSLISERSYSNKRELLTTIMFSLYRSGIRYEKKYNKQINNFLKSNFKYKWSKKDSNYVGEVLYGRKIENIILMLDKFEDLTKIELSCNHFERFGNNYKFMKYLKDRNYNFSKYNISTDCDLDWFINYFKLGFEEKDTLLAKFLYNLDYSCYIKENIKNPELKIEKILNYFLKSKKIKRMIKKVNINAIDCLIFSERKELKSFVNYFEAFRKIKFDNLKKNEKKINKNFYYTSSFYSEIDWGIILSGLDFSILNLKNKSIESYFKDKMLINNKFERGDIDSFFVFKHFLNELDEENLFKLYKKFEKENRLYTYEYSFKILEDKEKYFERYTQEDKFELLINSNQQNMQALRDIIEEIERRNRKYREGIEIKFNKGYRNLNTCIDICKLLDSHRQYHIGRNRKLEALNNKEIILNNKKYKLKYINNMEELSKNLIYFDKGLSFIVSNNEERVGNYSFVLVKEIKNNKAIGLLKYNMNDNSVKDILGELPNDVFDIDLGSLYDC